MTRVLDRYFTYALPTIIRPSIEELRMIAIFVTGFPALAAADKISKEQIKEQNL